MFDALSIGATGMQAQQLNVDTIANNLANVNTSGFKKARVSFSDLVSRHAAPVASRSDDSASGALAAMTRMGAGVGIASLARMFEAGDLKKTDSPYDLAIRGDGFLEVVMPDGSRAYSRGGVIKVNKDGQLANLAGYAFKPGIAVPDNVQELVVHNDGRVQARVAGQTGLVDIGQLELVRFANAQGLIAQGDNLYRSSDASGEAILSKAAEEGVGTLAQGHLESSNVRMVDEMVNLMVAQRTYEANVKVVQAADEMLGMINGLRR